MILNDLCRWTATKRLWRDGSEEQEPFRSSAQTCPLSCASTSQVPIQRLFLHHDNHNSIFNMMHRCTNPSLVPYNIEAFDFIISIKITSVRRRNRPIFPPSDSKTKGRDKVAPVRITRSVGLQVCLKIHPYFWIYRSFPSHGQFLPLSSSNFPGITF